MKKTAGLISFCCLLTAAVLPVAAYQAKKGESMKLEAILPSEISGWKKVRDNRFTREKIFDYLDGAGEIYLAYDFKNLFVREYEKAAAPPIVVEVFTMTTSADAYGVFTNDQDGIVAEMGQQGIYAAGLLRFWKNNVFVRIMAEAETDAAKETIFALARKITAAVPGEGKFPLLMRGLPDENGLQVKDIRFFHKQISLNANYFFNGADILGLDERTDCVLTRYEETSGISRILLIMYPNAQTAKKAADRYSKEIMKKDNILPNEYVSSGGEGRDWMGLLWRNRFLILVFEAKTQEIALKRLGVLNYELAYVKEKEKK